jgi:hypothetical protein
MGIFQGAKPVVKQAKSASFPQRSRLPDAGLRPGPNRSRLYFLWKFLLINCLAFQRFAASFPMWSLDHRLCPKLRIDYPQKLRPQIG